MSPNKTPRKYKQIAIVVNDIEKDSIARSSPEILRA
jgi:hypothetical protein